MINIIEDRRVEDLGVEYWEGSGPERAFVNAYAYSLRPSVGELWKDLVEGKDLNLDWVKKRRARVIHEAFLQRLLVGKIKDGTYLPTEEWLKVQEAASHVENQLEKMKKYKGDMDKVYADLERLTKYVIEKLGLIGFEPEIREFGKNSWDETFTEDYGRSKSKDEVRKGINTYFDEIWKVETVCEICGKHYTETLGVRKD